MTEQSSSVPPQIHLPEDRLIAAIGYMGILCFVPFILRRNSPFAIHHGKQGLILFIAWIILWAGNIIPILGQIVWVLGSIVLLILVILGIVNALQGKMWNLPVLGVFAKQIKL